MPSGEENALNCFLAGVHEISVVPNTEISEVNGGGADEVTIRTIVNTAIQGVHLHSDPESAPNYGAALGKVVRTFKADSINPNLPSGPGNINPEGNNYGPILQMRNLKEGEGILINSSDADVLEVKVGGWGVPKGYSVLRPSQFAIFRDISVPPQEPFLSDDGMGMSSFVLFSDAHLGHGLGLVDRTLDNLGFLKAVPVADVSYNQVLGVNFPVRYVTSSDYPVEIMAVRYDPAFTDHGDPFLRPTQSQEYTFGEQDGWSTEYFSQHPGEYVDPLAGRRYWVPRSALGDTANALFVRTVLEPTDSNFAQRQFRCWPNAQSVSDPTAIDLFAVMGPLSVGAVEKVLTWDDLPQKIEACWDAVKLLNGDQVSDVIANETTQNNKLHVLELHCGVAVNPDPHIPDEENPYPSDYLIEKHENVDVLLRGDENSKFHTNNPLIDEQAGEFEIATGVIPIDPSQSLGDGNSYPTGAVFGYSPDVLNAEGVAGVALQTLQVVQALHDQISEVKVEKTLVNFPQDFEDHPFQTKYVRFAPSPTLANVEVMQIFTEEDVFPAIPFDLTRGYLPPGWSLGIWNYSSSTFTDLLFDGGYPLRPSLGSYDPRLQLGLGGGQGNPASISLVRALDYPMERKDLRDDKTRKDIAVKFVWPQLTYDEKQDIMREYATGPLLAPEGRTGPNDVQEQFRDLYLDPMRSASGRLRNVVIPVLHVNNSNQQGATDPEVAADYPVQTPYIIGGKSFPPPGDDAPPDVQTVQLIDFRSRFNQNERGLAKLTDTSQATFREIREIRARLHELEDWRLRSALQ